jgi:hypothetical protein
MRGRQEERLTPESSNINATQEPEDGIKYKRVYNGIRQKSYTEKKRESLGN